MLRRLLSAVVRRAVVPAVMPAVRDEVRKAAGETVVASPQPPEGLDALKEAQKSVEKKLSMTMGAVQAATAKIIAAEQALERLENLANQALQRATSAQATAEAAVEGLASLEAASAAVDAPATCAVEGCSANPRKNGYCGKHQSHKRH